jgi:hypothetical protein
LEFRVYAIKLVSPPDRLKAELQTDMVPSFAGGVGLHRAMTRPGKKSRNWKQK